MQNLERICPQCGTGNAYANARCRRCGASLTMLQPLPTQPSRALVKASGGALVIGATMFLARVGLKLVLNGVKAGLEYSASRALSQRNAAPRSETLPQSDDYVLRGWRSWRVTHAGKTSTGTERFEWRIPKK